MDRNALYIVHSIATQCRLLLQDYRVPFFSFLFFDTCGQIDLRKDVKVEQFSHVRFFKSILISISVVVQNEVLKDKLYL